MNELLDMAFIIYILTSLVCSYGFLLFAQWLKAVEEGKREVYIYVMMLIFAIFIVSAGNTYARYLFLVDRGGEYNLYEDFILSWFWQVRAIPNFIFVSLIIFRMHRRAQNTIKSSKLGEEHLHRRSTDK